MSIRRRLRLSGLYALLGLASLASCSSLPTLVPDMARHAPAVLLARRIARHEAVASRR
jgi:hypothetical protein